MLEPSGLELDTPVEAVAWRAGGAAPLKKLPPIPDEDAELVPVIRKQSEKPTPEELIASDRAAG